MTKFLELFGASIVGALDKLGFVVAWHSGSHIVHSLTMKRPPLQGSDVLTWEIWPCVNKAI